MTHHSPSIGAAVRRPIAILATGAVALTGALVGTTAAHAAADAAVVRVSASQIGSTNVSADRNSWDSLQEDAFVPTATGFALDIENKPIGTKSLTSTGLSLDGVDGSKKVRYQYYFGTGGIGALDDAEGVTLSELIDSDFGWDAYFPNAYSASEGTASIDLQLEKELSNGQFQRTSIFASINRASNSAGSASSTLFSNLANGEVRANSQPAVVTDGVATVVSGQTSYSPATIESAYGDYTVVSFGPNNGRGTSVDNTVVVNAIHLLDTTVAFSALALEGSTRTFSLRDDVTTTSAFALPNGATLDGKNHTIFAADVSSSVPFMGAVVENLPSSTSFDVKDLTIDGTAGLVRNHNGTRDLWGIRYSNSAGTVSHTSVNGIKRTNGGDNDGIAFRIQNVGGGVERTVVLDHVSAENFQKGGLSATGNVAVDIRDSIFGHGLSSTPPNTLSFSAGADLKLRDSVIGGVQSTQNGIYRTSTGVLASGAGTIDIRDNTISGSDIPVYIASSGASTVFHNVITGPANPIIDPNEGELQYLAAVYADAADVSVGSNRITAYPLRYAFDSEESPYTVILPELGTVGLDPLYRGESAVEVEVLATNGVPGNVLVYATGAGADRLVGSLAVTGSGAHTVSIPVTNVPSGAISFHAKYVSSFDESEFALSEESAELLIAAADVSLSLNKVTAPYAGSPAVATVTVSPAGTTGTVQLHADGEPIGEAVAVDTLGKASIALPDKTLLASTWAITAVFTPTGDSAASFSAGESASRSLVVTKNATTAAIELSKTSQTYNGTPATITATVTKAIAGSVQFFVDGEVLGQPVAVTTSTGKAVLPAGPAKVIAGGKHAITATFTPTVINGYAESTSAAKSLTVTRIATATTVKLGGTSQTYTGTPVSVVATVTKGVDGTVQFAAGSTPLGAPVEVEHGATSTATLPADDAKLIPAGKQSVTAVFTPDADYGYEGSTSKAVTITVAKAPTSVQITTSGSSQQYGSASVVEVVATVPDGIEGVVQFRYGSTALGGEVEVEDGEAVASVNAVTFIPAGSHQLSAVFTPSLASYLPSTSSNVNLAVTALPSTLSLSTSLSEVPATWTFGDEGLGTIVAQATSGVPGKVQFFYGTNLKWGAPVAVNSLGRTTISLSTLPAGSAIGDISATFTPTNSLGRTSASAVLALNVTPNKAASVVTQVVPASVKTKSVIAVSVTGVDGAPVPSGQVRVYYTATKFVTVTLGANGTATATLPTIKKGTKLAFTAKYLGDLGYLTAASTTVSRTAK